MRAYHCTNTVRARLIVPLRALMTEKIKAAVFPVGKLGTDHRSSDSLNSDAESCSKTKGSS